MSSHELDCLILENWADLDALVGRADEIEEIVYGALAKAVEAWAKPRGWSGVFSTEGLWFAPPEWTTSPGRRPAADAWFQLEDIDGDEDHWSLSCLMGVGQGRSAFRLAQTRMGKRTWNAAISAPKVTSALGAFELDDVPSLILPLLIDRDALAPALLSRNFTELFQPVFGALDKMEAAVALITPLLGARPEAA